MGVPGRACAGLEGDMGAAGPAGFFGLEKRVDAHSASEPVVWPLTEEAVPERMIFIFNSLMLVARSAAQLFKTVG